jgi:putative adenylate-forming enzyme
MRFKLYILYYLFLFLIRRDHSKTGARLDQVKARRFRAMLRHLRRSPFYRQFVSEKSLEAFPVINKQVFMEFFDEINTLGIKKSEALQIALEAEESRDFSRLLHGVTVGLSTGTSGNKGLFLVGEKERARWAAAVIHRVIGIRWHSRTVAFFLRANSKLYESANSRWLRFNFFDLMEDHDTNFKRLVGIKADILVAQPSALLKLADSYIRFGMVPGFSKVISVAEVLEDSDRKYIQLIFGVPLDEVYQCTEGFLACSCKCGKLHLNEDFLIIEKEYVDNERSRYNPVITDLYRKTQPIVRYKLDDILMDGRSCTCGSQFEVVEKIEGRSDDVIRLKDNTGRLVDIYPDYFSRAITIASDHITDYILCQTGPDTLLLYINDDSETTREAVRKNLRKLFSAFHIENIQLNFVGDGIKEQHKKLRRIRNAYYQKLQDSRHG